MIDKIINLNSEDIVEYVLNNKDKFQIDYSLLDNMQDKQKKEFLEGEFYYTLFKKSGKKASQKLFSAQWNYEAPEWFDHRHHTLYPEKWFSDFWTMSADNILEVMPYNAKILNLCSGDGYYDYHFYSKRASIVDCIEFDDTALTHAKLHHSTDNINYIKGSVLDFDVKKNYYDLVIIRGAIEHFNEEEQYKIFDVARSALKTGGFFVGDTVEKLSTGKQLEEHDCEWESEDDMSQRLSKYFDIIKTNRMESHYGLKRESTRISLFWQCKKKITYEFLGTKYGGWHTPIEELDENSIVYAAGVGEDISFDVEVIEKVGCDVFAFDPTPRAALHVKSNAPKEKYHFYEYGIWDKDEKLRFYEPQDKEHVSHSVINLQKTDNYFEADCKKISTIMKELGHTHIDFLKLDIEGAEFKVIDDIVNEKLDIKYIGVEIHVGTQELRVKKRNLINALRNSGYILDVEDGHDYVFRKRA